jgi:phage shock protein A
LADVSDKPKKNGHDKKDGDVPKWAGKLINEMSEMKEQLKNVHHLETNCETLCKKVEELETKVNRLQTRKVNFKAAHSKSVTN